VTREFQLFSIERCGKLRRSKGSKRGRRSFLPIFAGQMAADLTVAEAW
jgi:hypothetical protein